MALGTNPDFLTIKSFFAGSNSFADYYRGGPYVPNIPANAGISASANGLSMTQFSGADKTSPLSVSASDVNVQVPEGSFSAGGSSYASASGGTGNYTYTWQFLSGVQCHQGSLNSSGLTFEITHGTAEAQYRVTVSDGVTTAYHDIFVWLSIGQPL